MLVYCVYVCKSLMIYIYKKKMKCYICAIAYVWDGVFVNRSQNLEPEISLTIFLELSFSNKILVTRFTYSALTNKIVFFDELTQCHINRIIKIMSTSRLSSFKHTCAIIEEFRTYQISILSSLRAH